MIAPSRLAVLLGSLAALLLAGCASVDPYLREPIALHLEQAGAAGDCARLLRDVDRRVDALGVRDASAPRVPGFPYLRVDRFTAALGERAAQIGGYAPWTELMARLDGQARAVELANAGDARLPSAVALETCRWLLAVQDEGRLEALRAAAQVPDDYSTAARTFGLYPLTKLAFAAGVRRYQEATQRTFDTPLAQLPARGARVQYAPARQLDAVPGAPQSLVFGLPVMTRLRWAEWILRHAPRLSVDTETDADRIGTLQWTRGEDGAPRLAVGTAQPLATVRIAYTLLQGRPHPQLVYTFWFPRRPAQSATDLLAGEIDALVWRVTLDADGAPLAYDAMHACGCYHQWFPTARVRARPQPDTGDETLFAPQAVAQPAAAERIVLHVAARTHYLQRITVAAADRGPALDYALTDDDALRMLPLPGGGTRSAFDADGLLPGSERGERWLFWPMGIASAGQMRQWGRHATAFVGRRHFDDPLLVEQYFEVLPAVTGTSD